VPLGFDQQFWGTRLQSIGVSPPPIKRRELTVAKLADALRQMRTDTQMQLIAADLGKRVRLEDGVGNALARIEAHASR
jgi:sterol 3beta-glucosyltransferase